MDQITKQIKQTIMTTEQLKEQMQQDLLSLLDGIGLSDALDPLDYEKLEMEVCDIVISNINRCVELQK